MWVDWLWILLRCLQGVCRSVVTCCKGFCLFSSHLWGHLSLDFIISPFLSIGFDPVSVYPMFTFIHLSAVFYNRTGQTVDSFDRLHWFPFPTKVVLVCSALAAMVTIRINEEELVNCSYFSLTSEDPDRHSESFSVWFDLSGWCAVWVKDRLFLGYLALHSWTFLGQVTLRWVQRHHFNTELLTLLLCPSPLPPTPGMQTGVREGALRFFCNVISFISSS